MRKFMVVIGLSVILGGVAHALEVNADVLYLGTDEIYDRGGDKKSVPRQREIRLPVSVSWQGEAFGLRVAFPAVGRVSGGEIASGDFGFGDIEVGGYTVRKSFRAGLDVVIPTGGRWEGKGKWAGGTMLGSGAGAAAQGGWVGMRPIIRVEPPVGGGVDLWGEGSYLLTLAKSETVTVLGQSIITKTNFGDPIRVASGFRMWFGILSLGGGLEVVTTGRTTVAVEGGGLSSPTTDVPDTDSYIARLLPEAGVKAGSLGVKFGVALPLAGKNEFAGETFFGGLLLKF